MAGLVLGRTATSTTIVELVVGAGTRSAAGRILCVSMGAMQRAASSWPWPSGLDRQLILS